MTLRRIVPAAAATFLVLLCGALYLLGYCEQYATLLSSLGAAPFRFPFLDTHAVLAAVQCHRQGIDVYTENPCDVFGRIHVYSPLWLALSALPITTDWTPAVGATLVGLFLLSLTLLPPGRGWAQVGIITLATLSGSVAFALERANNDLVIFILAALIIRLRWCGYALAVLAAMLKFYPAVLLALAVRERLWLFAAIGAAAAAALTGFAALYSHDLMRVLPSIPTTSYFDAYAFGARNLPFGLAETFGLPRGAAMALFGLFALILLVSAIMIVRRSGLTIRMDILSGLETASLLAGCVLVLACFFTAQNVLYRGVHFLFVVPGLTVLARRPGSGMARAFVALVLVLMFWELLRRHMDPALAALGVPPPDIHAIDFNVWLIRELFWWCAATGLVTLFLALLMRSRAADELRSVTRFFWKSRRIHAQRHRMRRALMVLLPFLWIAAAHADLPALTRSGSCDPAILNAERAIHLPVRLLGSIAMVESGRVDEDGRAHPWPWTINAEGRGQFFASKPEAIAAVQALQAKGVRSIDVGCMQVNLMHHPNAFASLDEAFDPAANALYAARFLNTLYGASGSWIQATAAYHSETPWIGAEYQQRVMARWMPGSMPSNAYRMFAPVAAKYGDFRPATYAYGDFAAAPYAPARLARR